ncbi:MAG TPA: PDZ domain-containing protein [Candidatus Acidoferrales bacterium]|nr:PDZ domain-containing protein [Candidatus Acidoferrales bacterium]
MKREETFLRIWSLLSMGTIRRKEVWVSRVATERVLLVFFLVFGACVGLLGQQQPKFLTPAALKGQQLRGSIAVPRLAKESKESAVGLNGRTTEIGFRVDIVVPGGPAERGGIRPGDVLLAIDGKSMARLSEEEFTQLIKTKRVGDALEIDYVRNGQFLSTTLLTEPTGKVYQEMLQHESQLPPAVSQLVFSGVEATVAVFLMPESPNYVFLLVSLGNRDGPAFVADDAKMFVLDGTGQQLRRISLDEVRYSLELSVFHDRKGPPPPPGWRATQPPPQRTYIIKGSETGNYRLSELVVNPVTVWMPPKPWSITAPGGDSVPNWESVYFKCQSPVIAGGQCWGQIMYWSGSGREPEPPFRVVLFLADPKTQREEHVTFAFGDGAESIREQMASLPTPLTLEQVLKLLDAGVTPTRIETIVRERGVAFELTGDVERKLRAAGATAELLLAIAKAKK